MPVWVTLIRAGWCWLAMRQVKTANIRHARVASPSCQRMVENLVLSIKNCLFSEKPLRFPTMVENTGGSKRADAKTENRCFAGKGSCAPHGKTGWSVFPLGADRTRAFENRMRRTRRGRSLGRAKGEHGRRGQGIDDRIGGRVYFLLTVVMKPGLAALFLLEEQDDFTQTDAIA